MSHTLINLTFVGIQMLDVVLVKPVPTLGIDFATTAPLRVEMTREVPALKLTLRPLQSIDAALLPVLIGPPGLSADDAHISPAFTYVDGRLVGVTYADGSVKTLTWVGGELAQIDFIRVGAGDVRKTLSYNPDGTLASVTQEVI